MRVKERENERGFANIQSEIFSRLSFFMSGEILA
jgi:hypothetical protein